MKARTSYEMPLSGTELRDGDTVTLANQWAKVTISVEVDEDANARIFKTTGDIVQFDERGDPSLRCAELVFPSARDAWNNAMASLAYFAEGRVELMNQTKLTNREFVAMLMQACDNRSYHTMLMFCQFNGYSKQQRNRMRAFYGIATLRYADGREEALD